mmetsp:Transcript_37810/g.93861  ORF Transcript_37810/g.93861 Transcript_37810/m.93861 type:complete len:382 (+) Transcript_37810:11-1156(+)
MSLIKLQKAVRSRRHCPTGHHVHWRTQTRKEQPDSHGAAGVALRRTPLARRASSCRPRDLRADWPRAGARPRWRRRQPHERHHRARDGNGLRHVTVRLLAFRFLALWLRRRLRLRPALVAPLWRARAHRLPLGARRGGDVRRGGQPGRGATAAGGCQLQEPFGLLDGRQDGRARQLGRHQHGRGSAAAGLRHVPGAAALLLRLGLGAHRLGDGWLRRLARHGGELPPAARGRARQVGARGAARRLGRRRGRGRADVHGGHADGAAGERLRAARGLLRRRPAARALAACGGGGQGRQPHRGRRALDAAGADGRSLARGHVRLLPRAHRHLGSAGPSLRQLALCAGHAGGTERRSSPWPSMSLPREGCALLRSVGSKFPYRES